MSDATTSLNAALAAAQAAEAAYRAPAPTPAEPPPAAAAEPKPAEPASFEEGVQRLRADIDLQADAVRTLPPEQQREAWENVQAQADAVDRAEAARAVRLYLRGRQS